EELRRVHAHSTRNYQALVLCMLPGRDALYRRIDARVDEMFAAGLLAEVAALRERYPHNSHPFGAIGYREVCAALDGTLAQDDLSETIKRNTRRLAKRQYTWW